MDFTNMLLVDFINYIITFNNIDDILEKCKNQSIKGFVFERLFDLARMVYADHILGPKQKEILTRFSLALGFTPSNVSYIVDKALSLLVLNVDLDTFMYEMQHMNK